ncbi:MAG: hypothetical protein HZA93_01105 [Verrucomicrobia bacterium]|nr:hypothetical protein [Verrucomicrobiota bacterium]
MSYTYAIEQAAAQTVFGATARERRLLQAAFEEIARAPMEKPDLVERDGQGRELFTRFCGPFAVTWWSITPLPRCGLSWSIGTELKQVALCDG